MPAREGRVEDAAAQYRRILLANPDDVTAAYNLGVVLRDQGRWIEAEEQFRHAVALKPAHVEGLNNLGIVVQRQGRAGEAAACYRRALTLNPAHAKAHYNLGVVLAETGELERAAESYRSALALKPDYARAMYGLVQVGGVEPGSSQAEAHLSLLLRQVGEIERFGADEQSMLLFAAGAAHEARGDYDQAFSCLASANAIERRRSAFDIVGVERRLQSIPKSFDRSVFQRLQGAGQTSERPIFIVGMARSGTTLVEQILSAHPEVLGAGEIPHAALLAERVAGSHGESGPLWTEALTEADCLEFGRAYLESLPAAPEKRRVTDKTLFNLEHLGLIHLALPRAKIIVCRRDPRDVCLSCFATRFSDGQAYANDLVDLARYWRAYDTLIAHWRAVLPSDQILEVRYEDLVGGLEAGARRMAAHCGLAWNGACLDFHRSSREVRTASFAQVRRPIYTGSVGRWRRFERHLGPLLAALGEPWDRRGSEARGGPQEA